MKEAVVGTRAADALFSFSVLVNSETLPRVYDQMFYAPNFPRRLFEGWAYIRRASCDELESVSPKCLTLLLRLRRY